MDLEAAFRTVQDNWRKEAVAAWVAPPKHLYHYTSGGGLYGIVKSNEVRGSNYAFMNDRSELAYGAALLRSALLRHAGEMKDLRIAEVLSAAAELPLHERFDLYLACFCEDADLLSQWRGYGAQESRYCIRFDSAGFKRTDPLISPVVPVIYSEQHQNEWLDRMIRFHVEAIAMCGYSDETELRDLASR